ncbi:MAG: DUF882 domain-containing protein [Roseiarcus sp.]
MAFDSAIGAAVRRKGALARLLVAPVLLSLGFAPSSTESAVANGDTRTISFSNSHTNESGSFTYMVDGVYDSAVLEKLNWFLRDWRLNEPTKMDPKLFDIVWEVYRESGSTQPIDVLSGYRSPQTNAALRRRSRQVAKYSQHMEGKAIDAHFVDVSTATIRDVAMRMQAGGVGFYPTGLTPWVHIDSGSVRYWPRMSRDALARLFPDGKTVFIPADGQPMPGYEQARAEIESRGGDVVTATAASPSSNPGLLSWLFGARGGGADDEEENGGSEVASGKGAPRTNGAGAEVASAAADPLADARGNLPRGATFMQPASDAAPQVVASADSNTESDAGPITLQGPIAAQFIAPLPPRKPTDLTAMQLAESVAPTPPQRPAEFAFASSPAQGTDDESAANRNLVAALLAKGKVPGVITRGVGLGAAPPEALALADATPASEPAERPAMLARAAALSAPLPPLPPTRAPMRSAAKSAPIENVSVQPKDASTKTVATASPPAAHPTRALALLSSSEAQRKSANPFGELSSNDARGKPSNPYGDLIYDAFRVAPQAPAAQGFAELRGFSE